MNIEFLTLTEAMDSFNFLAAAGFFVLYLFIEMLDSSLTFSLTQHRSLRSAIVTFILYITIAVEIAAVISNYLYILPVALGAALGSYIIVEYEKKKRPLKK
jgi:riboflavin transporter FmnP